MLDTVVIQRPEGGQMLALTFQDIKAIIVRGQRHADKISDQEVILFGQFCKSHMADPRRNDAYLIKYAANAPASFVLGKGHFDRLAQLDENFDGCKSGIILEKDGELVYRQGTVKLPNEKLIGGWAEVYKKNQTHPTRVELMVEQREAKVRDSEGNWTTNTQWRRDPGGMIMKCALVAAKREACSHVHDAYIEDEVAGPTAFDQAFEADLKAEEEVPTEEEVAKLWTQIETRISDSGMVAAFDANKLRLYMAHVREQLNKGAKKEQTTEQYLRKALGQIERSDKDLRRFLEGMAKHDPTSLAWERTDPPKGGAPEPAAGETPRQESVVKVGPEHIDFDQQMRDAIASYEPIGMVYWDDGGLPLIARSFTRQGQTVFQVGKIYTDGKFRALTHTKNLPSGENAQKAAEMYAMEQGLGTVAPWDVGKEMPQATPDPPVTETSPESDTEAGEEDDISLDRGPDALMLEFSQRLRSVGKGWMLDAYRRYCEKKGTDFEAAIVEWIPNWNFGHGESMLNGWWQTLPEEEKDALTDKPPDGMPF
jgi:phage recombination protein Bet